MESSMLTRSGAILFPHLRFLNETSYVIYLTLQCTGQKYLTVWSCSGSPPAASASYKEPSTATLSSWEMLWTGTRPLFCLFQRDGVAMTDLPFFPPQELFHSRLAQQIQWEEEGVLQLKQVKMREMKEEVVSSRGGAVGLATTGSARAREDLRCREVRDHRGGEGGGERLKEWALLWDLFNKSLKFFCENKPQVCCKITFLKSPLNLPFIAQLLLWHQN